MSQTSFPSRSSTCGSATRLLYQDGFLGAPPSEATAAYTPSCSTRMTGDLRSLPLLTPRLVRMTTGSPRIVVPSVPPEPSYFSTCSRTHAVGLGSYSPSRGMTSLPSSETRVTAHSVL